MRLGRRVGRTAPPQDATPSAPRQAAIVLASFAIAAWVTWQLTPVIGRAVAFPLVYVALALSTGIAGLRGGIFGFLVGFVIMATIMLPRSRIGGVRNPNEPYVLLAYAVTSVLIIAAVSAMRLARFRAHKARAELARANTELEHANEALGQALDEATGARTDAVERADRLRLLDEASSILASSLDYETTIAATARLMVPTIADWCSVDLLVEGEIKQLGVAQLETPEFRRLSEVRARSNLSADAATGLAQVIRTGEAQFITEMTDMYLAQQARSPEHLAARRAIGVGSSAMIVPMIARRQVIGALTMARAGARRPFDDGILDLARDVARRAAIAIDNARLYRKAVVANEAKSN